MRCLKKETGCNVVDLDEIGHSLLVPGHAVYKEVVGYFGPKLGPSFVGEDGVLERSLLSDHIFHPDNTAERRMLNRMTHPRIQNIALSQIFLQSVKSVFSLNFSLNNTQRNQYTIMEAPLLYETPGLVHLFSHVIVIKCSPANQLARLISRGSGMTKAAAKDRMETQMDNKEKVKRADFVVDNDGKIESLGDRVGEVWNEVERTVGGSRTNCLRAWWGGNLIVVILWLALGPNY